MKSFLVVLVCLAVAGCDFDTCSTCRGKGKTPCTMCEGGRSDCGVCVDGKSEGGACRFCKGTGRITCQRCAGEGWNTCFACGGKKKP